MSQFRIKRRSVTVGEGARTRTIPLTQEADEALELQLEAFRVKFGREPEPGDPIFFDPDSDVPLSYPLEAFDKDIVGAMVKAGIPPEKIYAFKKTGLIATQDNWDKMLPEDRRAWNDAMDEFAQLTDRPH